MGEVNRIAVTLLALTAACLAWPAEARDAMRWVKVRVAGIEAEIPEFLTKGSSRALMVNGEDTGTAYEPEEYPIALRIYRVPPMRPAQFLDAMFGGRKVTYRLDKPGIGVVSGYRDEDVFYAMCRPGEAALRCIDIVYAAAQKDVYDPMVTRISKSFRR